ncbi:MAG: hypothetical protein E7480_03770 [Ruminococcaceae bacterium]|nr:hypothetical protein [Oscillospiraceae bacterium]
MDALKKAQRFLQVKIILSAIFWFLSLVLIAVIISFGRQLSSLQSQKDYILKEIQNSISILDNVDLLKQSNDKYTEDTLKNEIATEDVVELEKSYWSYALEINGQPVTSNSVSVKPGTVTITVRETEKERVLPMQMHMMGSVTGFDNNDHYYKHVVTSSLGKEVSSQNFNQDALDRYSTFTFTVNSGESLKFNVSEILAERLNLNSKYITINVN